MTEHDFFNMLTNIDDKLIANAKPATGAPYDPFSDLPQKISPQRRSPWKSIAAAAACLAVVAVGIAVFFSLKSNKVETVSPSDSVPEGYPSDAKYQYIGDFTDLELVGAYGILDRLCFYSYEEQFDYLMDNSDVIVIGTFVDDARQNFPLTGKIDYDEIKSYNKLRIDRVCKGDVKVGDEIVISDNYGVNEGKLTFHIALTPMIKGEQWIYFLDKSIDVNYYRCVGTTDGRFPVPGNENTFVLTGDNTGVYDSSNFNKDAYEDVKKMLGYFDGVETILAKGHADGDICEFDMPDFFGETFVLRERDLYVVQNNDPKTSRVLYAAPGILSMYLADLNGDGKRELISECWNGLSGLSASYILVYDHANSKLYGHYVDNSDKYGMLTSELKLKDNVLYVETYELGSFDNPVLSEPLTFDKLTEFMEGEPEPEQIVYDGKTYNIVSTLIWDDEEFLSVGLTQYEYQVGSFVEVLAMVYNYTDKPMGLLMPVEGEGSHTEVGVALEHGDTQLYDVSVSGVFADAMDSHIIQPGETYYQVMRFDTLAERFDPEKTMLPLCVPVGNYEGRACISVLEDPNDTNSETTDYELKFNVNIVDRRSAATYKPVFFEGFTVDEFPDKAFYCNREEVRVRPSNKSDVLYEGMPIESLYLHDLNGDGKPELCSTVCVGSGIIDERIRVYDYANGKLYELSDRGNYDYRVEPYSVDEEWNLTAAKYKDGILVSSEPLTLDIMTMVRDDITLMSPVDGTTALVVEHSDIGMGIDFTMPEFPGVTFKCNPYYVSAKTDEGETSLFAGIINGLFLADLNGDGKRELAANISGSENVYTWVHIYDFANKRKYDIAESGVMYHVKWIGGDPLLLVRNDVVSYEPMKIEPAENAEVILDENVHRESFTLPEFFDFYEFTVGETSVEVKRKDGVKADGIEFPSKMTKVYLYDCNGDGIREIVAEGRFPNSGLIATYIQAFDPSNSKRYSLTTQSGYYEYGYCTLEVSGGKINVCLSRYDGTEILSEPLTLDIMTEVREDYDPQAEAVLDENVHKDIFTMPEYEDLEFAIKNGDIIVKDSKNGSEKTLVAAAEVKKVYLFDTNGNGRREIFAEIKRSGENNTVICMIYMKRDDFSVMYNESIKKGYDMEMRIENGKIIEYDTAD